MKNNWISILCIFLFGFICNAQNNNKWKADIDFYHKTLEEKHINLYHTISKKEFETEIENLKNNLPLLTDFQIITALMRITQKVGGGKGDGHTSVPLWNKNLTKYPITLSNFNGNLRVVNIAKSHEQFLGNRLQSINNIPVEYIYKKVSKLTPFTENQYSLKDRTCSYILISEILNALNITTDTAQTKFTFIDAKGVSKSTILKAYTSEALDSIHYEKIKYTHPSITQPKDSKFKNLWFSSFNNTKTVYIKCKAYPSEEEMNNFSKKVYQFIQENKSEHLIIDLRDNYGGDFFKGLLLSSYLNACESINWESNVYVLINRKTYSAAMVNAIQFKQLLNAKLVGEPTGANPNGYQDMGQFNLPNSKLLITYSKRLFRLQDTKSNGVQPDIYITSKWENYKNGMDEILNWVVKDISNLN
ncbi:S41 family peptidase [Oceanihabitans sp. 2_MG-2023]|uniref:S41 family peptidase n=1 Tax=Oceanihabitans sp. 2_MG-2023 TaxID=3062661 RepID=UPI0026E22AC6|nr:S41 family peptidase [Oceanihabitans sp. 2_MG-2023]MDO6596614.1 S41 family peptidase [Oceanihabitans sp. 2_MG-2023]